MGISRPGKADIGEREKAKGTGRLVLKHQNTCSLSLGVFVLDKAE